MKTLESATNEKLEKLSDGFLKAVTSLNLVNTRLQDHGAQIATLRGTPHNEMLQEAVSSRVISHQ